MAKSASLRPMDVKLGELQDRLTATIACHFQHHGNEPQGTSAIAVMALETIDKEPFSRPRLKITEEWKELDIGWVEREDLGVIVVENIEGKNLRQHPTEEEKKEISQRILQISFDGTEPHLDVAPGNFAYLQPSLNATIYVRGMHGQVTAKLHVFPR